MSAGSDPGLARVCDAESCREWLRTLPGDEGERLAAIGSLITRLSHARANPDVVYEVLEALRVAQVASIGKRLDSMLGRPVPYSPADWQRVGAALANLRASRNLYKRIWAQMLRGDDGDSPPRIPGTSDTLRTVMPLIRALDAQARIVSLLLRHHCVPAAADWDELCVLARHTRRTSFQDEPLADDVALVRPTTARALFVFPLLLECAALVGRPTAEQRLAVRLAARLAARVGFRVDRGAPRENAHGPRIALTADHAVRLDAHRVPARLAQRRQQWLGAREEDASTGTAMPDVALTHSALGALLDDLERRWTAAGAPLSAGAHPAAAQPLETVRLRPGLPRMYAADVRMRLGDGAVAAVGAAQRPGGMAPRYDYGRWEQNTIMRLALGAAGERDDPLALLMSEGETAVRLADRPGGRLVVARRGAMPPARGSLLAIGAGAGAGEGPRGASPSVTRLRLGVVEGIEQLPDDDGVGAQEQRLVLRCWLGSAVPVGVRVADSRFFEDAWLLRASGAEGELPCLVMAPGRAHGGAHGQLREGGADLVIRFVCVLERGSGYERVSIRIEPARDAR